MIVFLSAAFATTDPILDAMVLEVGRAMDVLGNQPGAPYFLAAEATHGESLSISAEDGALHGYAPRTWRRIDVEARLGAPDFDSSHPLRSDTDRVATSGRDLPLTDDTALLRREIWREVDARVREARSRWAKVSSDKTLLVDEEPGLDLAPTEPVVELSDPVTLDFDPGPWEGILRRVSAVLAQDGVVRDGQIQLHATAETSWVVTSEGTRVRHGRTEYGITVDADTIAPDGALLRLSERWAGHSAASLPTEQALTDAVEALHAKLTALREAPDQPPYTGPVILTDRAAGVFFHEIFGHRVEGERMKRSDNAQTFKDRVGEQILPAFLSVYDDPTLADYRGVDLRGAYRFDDEGVPAQRVVLVEDGALRGFLQSRSVLGTDTRSNGHGRRQAGRPPVARQGNLIVEASAHVTDAQLREALIAMAIARGLPYALRIDDIQGGFTFTNRGTPNAFTVDVLVATRIWTDGRPDELVRGIDLIGTPLVAFQRIVHAGEQAAVFNGVCGAESGWVPVSAAAPSLLVSELETQRKGKAQAPPPLLPPPRRASLPSEWGAR